MDGVDAAQPEDGTGSDVAPVPDLASADVTDVECASPSDCETLIGPCERAVCEDSRCVIAAAGDGTPCDDGDLCTEDDACTTGVCAGAAKACPAVSQCHLAGSCDSTTGACTTPPKLDGSPCDDGNLCTVTDTCRLGVCLGAGRPEVDDHAIAIVTTDPALSRKANLGGLVATASSTWTALWAETSLSLARGSEVEDISPLHDLEDGACELGVVRWASPTATPRFVAIGGYANETPCPANTWADAALGSAALTDDSFLLGGVVSGRLPLANGRDRDLGESTLGLEPRGSFWLARVGASGELLWTVEAQGYLGQSLVELELPMRTVTANRANTIAFAVTMLGGAAGAELVDAGGEGVAVEPVAGQAGGIVYRIDLNGNAREFVRLTAAPGGATVSALALLDDDRVAAAGVVRGGILNVEHDREVVGQIPTGLGGQSGESWLALLNGDGSVSWSWHVFTRPSYSGPSPSDDPFVMVAPIIGVRGTNGIWFGMVSGAPLDGRPGIGEAIPLSTSWPNSAGLRTTLVQFDPHTGALSQTLVLEADASVITSGAEFRNDFYVAGVLSGVPNDRWRFVVPPDGAAALPFVSGVERWTVIAAEDSGALSALVAPGESLRQPLLSAARGAIFTAFQSEGPLWTANADGLLTVSTPAIVVRQLNTNSSLDCR